MLMNRFYYLLLLAVFSLVSPAVQAAGAGTNYLTKLQAEMLRLISTPERDKFLEVTEIIKSESHYSISLGAIRVPTRPPIRTIPRPRR